MTLVRLYILLGLLGGEVMQGWAPRYAKGVMERVVAKRGLATDVCHVSSAYYPIGTPVYVYGLNTGVLRGCIVSDVSQPAHVARHRAKGWPVELGFSEAISLCGIEHINDPPRMCPVLVFKLEE